MTYRINFAPNLGFPTIDTPLFSELVGSTDPVKHVEFAAANGFRYVQDPFAAERSNIEQQRIGDAATSVGIELSCFVYSTRDKFSQPGWSATEPSAQRSLEKDIASAIQIGRRLRSRHIAVLTGTDPDRPLPEQRRAMSSNLSRFAKHVAEEGMILCVEAVNAKRLPHMLLHHFADAVDVVRTADHPAVRLIFDTAHIQAMDGDILGNLDAAWDLIELVQLADHPGRVEPGAGELNMARIIQELERRGFSGPCELEHLWSAPGPALQRRYLQWLNLWVDHSADQRDIYNVE